MPIFTQPISQQNTGYQAGVFDYPQVPQCKQYAIFFDEFFRESLTPTGAYTMYSTGGVGTPTFTSSINGGIVLGTTTSSNDNAYLRTSGQSFTRLSLDPTTIDARSQIMFDILFELRTSSTNTEGYVGLLNSSSGLTALPTTAKHLGISWNTGGANSNFYIDTGNGSAQVMTDTGKAIDITNVYRLNINWNGLNSATITLYSGTNRVAFQTVVFTSTITAINADNVGLEFHSFVQTLTTSSAGLAIFAIKAAVT